MSQISAPFLHHKQASVTPPHHLIGTQPSREWEIVSLKIGCPLVWLSPPSLHPPLKGTRLAVQGKTSRKAAATERAGRCFWRGSHRVMPSTAQGGWSLPAPCFWKESFPAPPALGMIPKPLAPLEVWGQSHRDCPCPPGWWPQPTHC